VEQRSSLLIATAGVSFHTPHDGNLKLVSLLLIRNLTVGVLVLSPLHAFSGRLRQDLNGFAGLTGGQPNLLAGFAQSLLGTRAFKSA